MSTIRTSSTFSALTLTLAVAPALLASGPRYRAVVLEPADAAPIVEARGINEAGAVAGTVGWPQVDPGQHAVVWTEAGMIELDPMFDISNAAVIADSGVVAGVGSFCPPLNGPCTSSLWRAAPGEELVPVGTLGGNAGLINAINAIGDFVGWWHDDDGLPRAFLHSGAEGLLDLGTLGGFASDATDVNASGQVVGGSYTAEVTRRAFLWQNGKMVDLGTLGGGDSDATAINEAGTIVGWAETASGETHAFRLGSGAEMQDLQTLPEAQYSRATVVNGAGDVGGIWSDGTHERAFFYRDGEGMIDLGDVAPDLLGFVGPQDINGTGVMVGIAVTGTYQPVAWLWDPQTGLHPLDELIHGEMKLVVQSIGGLNEAGQIAVTGHEAEDFTAQHAAVLEPVAPADLDASGAVDVDDLLHLLQAWGTCAGACLADLDGDGAVTVDDLVLLLLAWG